MLPVLFLAIQPHHRVLDLCASPGSKTRQILHAISGPAGRRGEHDDTSGSGGEMRGVVVANDVNMQRCCTLVIYIV